VDSFPLLYPDIKRVGTLIVAKDDSVNLTDIHDLSPLAQLQFVNSLYISNNGPLQTLDGLQWIDTLEYVTIFNNPSLKSLYGLHETRKLYGLTIRKNNALPNLQGLNKLRRLDGMTIERCANLTSLSGADSLDYVFGSISIRGNPRLKSVSGFPSLGTVGLLVTHNDSLLHFGHFPKMMNFGISVQHNAMLQDFSELPPFNPGAIVGIGAIENPSLTSFAGCETTPYLLVNVVDNPALEELSTFDYVPRVGAVIQGPAIRKICFPKADTVESFQVYNCPRLKTLVNVLPNADTVGQFYEIYQNDSLHTIHEDQGPKHITRFRVYDNPQLEYITGFEAMERVSPQYSPVPPHPLTDWGTLSFHSPKFSKISGFNNLKQLGTLEVVVPGYYSFLADPDIQFEAIEGFNGLEVSHDEIKFWPKDTLLNSFPRKLLGFQNLHTAHTLKFFRIRDTLSAFQNLETLGPVTIVNGNYGSLYIHQAGSCRVDPATFAQLKTVRNANMSIQYLSSASPAFKFPELEFGPNAFIGSYGALDTTLVGLFPKLKTARKLGIGHFKHIRSLDGIESLSAFAAPTWTPGIPPGKHINIRECDSLSDCSALCVILKNATFSPPQWSKVYLENPHYPCDDAANIELWCDSLSSAVEDPAAWEGRTTLHAFPNPLTAADLTLQLESESSPGPYEVRVADALGRMVYVGQIQFYGKLGILPTSGLAPGWHVVYLGKKGEPVRSVTFVRN
jgi:hypothetical protein